MRYTLIIMIAAGMLTACSNNTGDKAEVSSAQEKAQASEMAAEYSVDLNNSKVTWIGSKPAGRHNGSIKLESGRIHVEQGVVTAGEFVMDLNTVNAEDEAMDASKNERLTKHLKSADFFDVEKYPTARFEIVNIEPVSTSANEGSAFKLEGATHMVTGNLAMKDSVKAVTFPAIIQVSDSGVNAEAAFTINRTDWGMYYKSDKSFGDQIIHPEVEIGFFLSTR